MSRSRGAAASSEVAGRSGWTRNAERWSGASDNVGEAGEEQLGWEERRCARISQEVMWLGSLVAGTSLGVESHAVERARWGVELCERDVARERSCVAGVLVGERLGSTPGRRGAVWLRELAGEGSHASLRELAG